MRIHGDLVVAEGGQQHHARRLLSHAGQRHELFAVARHLAVILLDQRSTGRDDVLCLIMIQSAAFNVRLQLLGRELCHGERIGIEPEERLRHLVDTPVGTLS